MTPRSRRLYAPVPVAVQAAPDGLPLAVGGDEVVTIREEWVVDDRWWLPRKLVRHYFELVLASGRAAVVFRCARSGRWYCQRA